MHLKSGNKLNKDGCAIFSDYSAYHEHGNSDHVTHVRNNSGLFENIFKFATAIDSDKCVKQIILPI